nr:hypothetical protein [Pseudonocardia sp. EC080619-01]
MAERGITDLSLVVTCPFSAGSLDLPGEKGHRMLRVPSFLQHRPDDSPGRTRSTASWSVWTSSPALSLSWSTPGSSRYRRGGNFGEGPYRETRTPLYVTQAEGPSFTVTDDEVVEWESWRFRVEFDPREGLVLHQVSISGRPVAHRMAVAEMVVPYATPARSDSGRTTSTLVSTCSASRRTR